MNLCDFVLTDEQEENSRDAKSFPTISIERQEQTREKNENETRFFRRTRRQQLRAGQRHSLDLRDPSTFEQLRIELIDCRIDTFHRWRYDKQRVK